MYTFFEIMQKTIDEEIKRRIANISVVPPAPTHIAPPEWLKVHFRELGLPVSAEGMDNLVIDYYKGQEAIEKVRQLEDEIYDGKRAIAEIVAMHPTELNLTLLSLVKKVEEQYTEKCRQTEDMMNAISDSIEQLRNSVPKE